MVQIDDSELYVSRFSKVCTYCKHLDELSPLGKVKTCTAFPKGIPDKIWTGKNDHKKPYRGDHGIQFELHPDAQR